MPLEKPAQDKPVRIYSLYQPVKEAGQVGDFAVVCHKIIELMPVHGQISFSVIVPGVLPACPDTEKIRNNVDEPLVVIPFYPYHFFLCGYVFNVGKKIPVDFVQSVKIEVIKNIPEKNQSLVSPRVKDFYQLRNPAELRA
jgi:hypothetical protein